LNIVTHALLGWCAAQRLASERRDMLIATAGSVAPDLDAIGILAGTGPEGQGIEWFSRFHHVLAHNFFAGILFTVMAFALAKDRFRAAVLVLLLFHAHLLCDVIGSRGPDGEQWAIPYLYPASNSMTLTWSGQWEVNAWPNLLFTVFLLFLFFKQARDRGFSALWFVSASADAAFIETLRARFPIPVKG